MYGGRRHLPFPVELEALLVLRGREVGMLGRGGGRGLSGGAMCSVTGAVSVPRQEMRHVSLRGLGHAMPWGGQGRDRYYGQVVGGGGEEEGRGRKNYGADGILHVLLPKDCPLQKGHGARRLVVLMPGGMEYLSRIKTFTVSFLLLISSFIWTLSHTRETPLSAKTLGLACASHSAVTVSHSLPRNACSKVSLQVPHNAEMPHPACFFLQWAKPYCCPLTSPLCLTALGMFWACQATVLTCFFPRFRWPRSSCRRSVSRWGQVNQKR